MFEKFVYHPPLLWTFFWRDIEVDEYRHLSHNYLRKLFCVNRNIVYVAESSTECVPLALENTLGGIRNTKHSEDCKSLNHYNTPTNLCRLYYIFENHHKFTFSSSNTLLCYTSMAIGPSTLIFYQFFLFSGLSFY